MNYSAGTSSAPLKNVNKSSKRNASGQIYKQINDLTVDYLTKHFFSLMKQK